MRYLALFQVLVFALADVSSFSDNSNNFLLDFFKDEMSPLLIKSCWTLKTKLNFLRSVFKQDYFKRVVFLNSEFEIRKNHILYPEQKWIVTDLTSCNLSIFLTEMDESHLFRMPTKHLILVEKEGLNEYEKVLNTLEFSPMSYVILAVFTDKSSAEMFSVYKYRSDEYLIMEKYGDWSENESLNIFPGFDKPYLTLAVSRRNFNKRKINLGVVLFHDQSIVEKITDFDDVNAPSYELAFAQEMPILYTLVQYINATLVISTSNSHGYTTFNKTTGKLSGYGLVWDLYNKKLDLGSAMYCTKERVDLIDRVGPIYLQPLNVFFKKPSLSSAKNIYVMTLSKWVWFATLIVTGIFLVTLHFALYWESKTQTKGRDNYSSSAETYNTASEMMLLFWQALCQQGTHIQSKRISGRILLLMIFTLFMFLYVAFSASILVLLRSTADINDFKELMDNKMQVGALNEPFVKYYLENSRGILRKLYLKKMKDTKYIYNTTEGFKKLKGGNFAYFAPIVPCYKFLKSQLTNSEVCDLKELHGNFDMRTYPTIQKFSGYSEILKVGLLTLIERGISDRTKKREVRKPTCNNQAGSFQSVDIFDCLSVFVIFAIGGLLSLILLVIEKAVANFTASHVFVHGLVF